MTDPLERFWVQLRDWTYDHYYLAYLVGTGVLCFSLAFPSKKWALISWAVVVVLGIVLEPCVNPYNPVYGASLGRLEEENAVALTFDDGPAQDTPALLDLLGQLEVPATFFCVGRQLEQYPEVARRIAAEGHTLANHTEEHVNLMTLLPGATRRQLQRVQERLHSLTGQTPRWWRPPYGFRAPWTFAVARRLGLKAVLWSCNPRDFHNPGPQVIVDRVLEKLRSGDIILLHDGFHSRGQTLQAVALLVPELRRRGFKLVKLHG